jgi:3-isopropylmalate/(R)-2-methylmalate dehydratase small subunit
MEPVRTFQATAVPLPQADVDTDQIIPSDWLKRVERTGFGQGLFSEWREDPEFVLNQPQFKNAEILLAGPNFGIGSSREHAVWALMDYGFRAVISSRFGDIFRNNSTKNGLLAVTLPQSAVDKLIKAAQQNPAMVVSVDVEKLTVSCDEAGINESFPLDEFTQHRFLNGLDDIGITEQYTVEIEAYESKRPSFKPKVI